MTLRIHILVPTLILFFLSAESQKISKSDKITLVNLQTHIRNLSADTAGGLGMGMPGEKITGDYIISELSKAGARPKGDNSGWLQNFTIDQGRQISADAFFSVDDKSLAPTREWFPLSISPAGQVNGSPAIALQESGVPWFQDLKELLEAGSAIPRFDLVGAIRAKAAACAKKGATALILYNSSSRYPDKLAFDQKDKPEPAVIPVLYITREAKRKYMKDESASLDLRIRIGYTEQQRSGRNVIGQLDNGAATTAVIGTRYDNNSGIAAMLELAHLLAASKLRNNNYLFIVFSGSNMESLGSGYFTTHPVTDLKKVDYLLVLDQLGSMNETTHTLTIGGYTTSPAWPACGNSIRDKKYFSFRYDSTLPAGDHIAFYKQQIPLLIFSTGPDHASTATPGPGNPVNYVGELQVLKYIYSMIEAANNHGKIEFAP